MQYNAFFLRPPALLLGGWHCLIRFQTDQMNFFCAKPAGDRRAIERDISTAEHDNAITDLRWGSHCVLPQEVGVDQHTIQVVAFDRECDAAMRADRGIDRVKPLPKQIRCGFNAGIRFERDAEIKNILNLQINCFC